MRPRPSGLVQTYPEGGSHALQVGQHHHQVVRVGHFVGLAQRLNQGTWCSSRLLRPIRLKPSRSLGVAGGGPSVHGTRARCSFVLRDGDKLGPKPAFIVSLPRGSELQYSNAVRAAGALELAVLAAPRTSARQSIGPCQGN